MTLGSAAPRRLISNTKLSRQIISLGYALIIMSVLTGISFQIAAAKPPRQVEILMTKDGGACESPIALYEGERMILQLPSEVRVAIPSKDGLIDVFLSEQMVVVNPTSHSLRKEQDERRVTLTFELASGATFICTFELLSRAELLDPHATIELIKVRKTNERLNAERSAIELIERALHEDRSDRKGESTQLQSTPLNEILSSWRDRVKDQALQELLSAHDFRVSSSTPLRAQDHLIYVTIERAIISRSQLYLRARLQNRSQDPFELISIYYFIGGSSNKIQIWPRETLDSAPEKLSRQLTSSLTRGTAPIYLGLISPLNALSSSGLYFEASDGRTVKVKISELTELSD